MPAIVKQPSAVPSTPVTEVPDGASGFIRLPDGELYFYNGTTWVGLNGAKSVYHLDAAVAVGDVVLVEEDIARVASATVDKGCSGVVTHITPARHGVVTSAGRIPFSCVAGQKYFLGTDGGITATPNPDTQHIVLIGTGEGDTLLLTLGVSSEAPI